MAEKRGAGNSCSGIRYFAGWQSDRTHGQCNPIWWRGVLRRRNGEPGIFDRRISSGTKNWGSVRICRNRFGGRRVGNHSQGRIRCYPVWKDCDYDWRLRKVEIQSGKQGRASGGPSGTIYASGDRACLGCHTQYDKSSFCSYGGFFLRIEAGYADFCPFCNTGSRTEWNYRKGWEVSGGCGRGRYHRIW